MSIPPSDVECVESVCPRCLDSGINSRGIEPTGGELFD
jgi:hypothetical protein